MKKIINKKMLLIFILALGSIIMGFYLYRAIIQRKESTINREIKEVIPVESQKNKRAEEYNDIIEKIVQDKKEFFSNYTKKDSEINVLIEQLKSQNWEVVQKAGDRLVSLGKSAIPALLEALKGANVALKGEIIFILGKIGDKESTPVLIEASKDDNDYIRRNAVEALGKIKDGRALTTLTGALFDNDGSVRECSAWALGELKDPQAVGNLLDRITDEKEERVKSAVVRVLGELKDQKATSTLLAELKSKSDQLYKNEVVISLGEIGDPLAIPELMDYLNNLKQNKPKESIVIFQWEQAIKIAEDTLRKIQENNG
jgi:HEAT repeat protein